MTQSEQELSAGLLSSQRWEGLCSQEKGSLPLSPLPYADILCPRFTPLSFDSYGTFTADAV